MNPLLLYDRVGNPTIANLLNDRLVVLERKVEEAREALDEHKRKWRHVAGCECHDKEQSNKCWSMDKSDGATQGKHTALWLHQHPHRDSRCSPATAESAQAPVVADTKLEEAVREAHHCRANLILTHIEPPEKAHAENVALQKAIDRIAPLARLEGRLEEANIMLGIAVKYSGGPYPEMDTERDRLRAEVKRG